MANHSLTMKKLHNLIVYIVAGKSKRFIADALQISRHTIDNYLGKLKDEIGDDLRDCFGIINISLKVRIGVSCYLPKQQR